MTTKHTVGPWKLDGRNVLGLAFDGSFRCIAPVSGGTPESADANAKLIAAAPDLLQACQLIVQDLKDQIWAIGGCDHSVNICACGYIANLKTVEQAIEKATL